MTAKTAIGAGIGDYCALSPQECDLIDRAERFAKDVIVPNAEAWEQQKQPGLPPEVVAAWTQSGLLGMQVSTAQGGQGASYLAKIGVVEALARHCMGSAFSLCNLQNGPLRIARDGTPEQIGRYLAPMLKGQIIQCPCLTEPQSGSDFAAMKTMARRVEGGWRLTGEKAWITNGVIGHLGLLYAQTAPEQRAKGIGCFLVDMRGEGCEVSAPYSLATGSVIGAASLKLQDVYVAGTDVFYAPGQAFKQALGSINSARTYVAAMCCAMVAQALDTAIAYGRQRVTFGQPIVEHQGLRWYLAEIGTELEAARLLTYRAATLIDAGADAMMAAAMAKKYAVEMAERRLPNCLQILGAAGLRTDQPLARHMLSTKIAGFVDGSTEIQNDRIGRLLAQG